MFVLVVLGAGFWLYGRIAGSLPQLDGEATGRGLAAEVVIERNAQGIPTITGRSRVDVAYGLGFAHGQDRFFQMDLLRRNSSGELSGWLARR